MSPVHYISLAGLIVSLAIVVITVRDMWSRGAGRTHPCWSCGIAHQEKELTRLPSDGIRQGRMVCPECLKAFQEVR